MIAAAALFAFQTPVDPMKLEIGSKQLVNVQINRVTNTATGEHSTLEAIAAAADGKKFVYIGEEHDSPDAHRWQALIIGALVKRGRDVVIGMEMYQRPKQGYLDMWTLGKFTEEQFLVESDWQGQWGFAWDLYRPIFVFAKENGLRMVGLNVPRDWVRTASRTGYDALPNEAKSDLPEMYLGNQDHKKIFDALVGGGAHPGPGMDGMYRGQVLWDEAMADTAIKYFQTRYTSDRTVFVVLAGNGHVMYKQGINYRVQRRTGQDGVTVVTVSMPKDSNGAQVSAGLGDFVVGTREPDRSKSN
ncbi:MAG: ChaN family lipoprotein [Fimbriimonadales bacterium]